MSPTPANEADPDLLKPPLKWAGGKRWLVPHLQVRWARYQRRRYIEPFCGGLAMALGLLPERALLNDVNTHVVNFYRWLQQGLRVEIEMSNDSAVYYAHRAAFNALIEAGESETQRAAEYFYYLNRTGYNGLCRFNRSGLFNVPFGQYKNINYTRDFRHYAAQFAVWQFSAVDFERLMLQAGDFVYADPPYDVEFVSYSKEGFSWDDQVRLAAWLAAHDGPVIASNQATERVIALYTELGFRIEYHEAPRRISNTGDRTPAREIVATRGLA